MSVNETINVVVSIALAIHKIADEEPGMTVAQLSRAFRHGALDRHFVVSDQVLVAQRAQQLAQDIISTDAELPPWKT